MPDHLVALDEAVSLIEELGTMLQDIDAALAQVRNKLEETLQTVESMRDPIETSSSDRYAREHDNDDDENEGGDDDWPDPNEDQDVLHGADGATEDS